MSDGFRGWQKPRHKYRARRVEHDGIKFPSKREARRYEKLKLLRQAGEVVFFLRQVPFHLPGGVKYVCDFLVFWADGSVTVEDSKGVRTDLYRAKQRLVEATYPIEISEV